jgi:hypothetical protein
MNPPNVAATPRRKVYCILSARSLPYAEKAIESLVAHSIEDIDLMLITDGPDDKAALLATMQKLQVPPRHAWRVSEQAEGDERARVVFANYPHLAAFRLGHPCWRKITDPLLFAAPDEEMVILDPDLYFPNRFRFEPTPAKGLLLMYQPPSCLLPPEVVVRAYDEGIRLAHHTDIGVAQVRNNIDLAWLDQAIGKLGGTKLPRAMHVESIVWAALAMREGGGYLDPTHWHCWRNSQWKRLALRLGATGRTILRSERFGAMKCFHGGGIAKWWVPEALKAGELPEPTEIADQKRPAPFEELTRAAYESTQRAKAWARRLGYYRLVKS